MRSHPVKHHWLNFSGSPREAEAVFVLSLYHVLQQEVYAEDAHPLRSWQAPAFHLRPVWCKV